MKLQKVEVFLVRAKLKQPFKIALGEITFSEGYIVRLETKDGTEGFGEASPSRTILGDDMEIALRSFRDIASEIMNYDPLDYEKWGSRLSRLGASSSARAAIDMALFDIIGKHYGAPLYQLLGGYRERVETDYTIGIKSKDAAVNEALELVKKGFRILKIKVGEDLESDLERVRAIREAVGDSVKIRVDANQGWSFTEAVRAVKELEKCEVELLEQPLEAKDLRGLAKLRRISKIPIMLDESVHNAEDAIYAIKIGAADVINIKLMKSGGIREAWKIAHIAEAAGIPCMVGCMSETEVGILAGVHFACGLGNVVYADLDADLMIVDHVLRIGTIEIPYRVPPPGPGLGFGSEDLNKELLKKVLEVTAH